MKNVNFDFLLDLWADLKARRLAPVAVGLVVAAVAMPALLLEGEESAGEGPLPILASNPDAGPEVEVAAELGERGSKLDSYSARDPFKGRLKSGEAGGTGGTGTGSGAAIAPGDGSDLGKAGDDVAKSLPGLGSGGSSGGSTGSTGSGGDLGSTTPPAPSPPPLNVVKRRHHRYTFQLDLKFGRPGREKRYTNVTRLSFLPKPSLPALLFMGVPVHEKSALFFVHPGLTHQGEGSCVPTPKNCNFLELGLGEQHYLSANDHEFRIELLKVKRVRLRDEKEQRAAARKSSTGRRSSRSYADGAAPGAEPAAGTPADEQVEFPWLVDGIG